MQYKLQKLNVVRIVDTDKEKDMLIGQGFEEISETVEETVEVEIPQDNKGKKK